MHQWLVYSDAQVTFYSPLGKPLQEFDCGAGHADDAPLQSNPAVVAFNAAGDVAAVGVLGSIYLYQFSEKRQKWEAGAIKPVRCELEVSVCPYQTSKKAGSWVKPGEAGSRCSPRPHKDPNYGCQIGSECPIVHVK
jgi:hypothetical protein